MSQPKYYIYPSLLDKFQKYLDADEEFEGMWNLTTDGEEYKRSHEEIERELEQSLIDAVNRTPHEPIEAADKGTCFNALVDWLNGDTTSIPLGYGERVSDDGEVTKYYGASLNGFEFEFDADFSDGVAKYFNGAIPQYRCKSVLPTCYGDVCLYGVIDEICMDTVKDIKTTSMYQYGKFEKGWQRHVYPYCLVTSGVVSEIRAFEYSVYRWDSKYAPFKATFFKEVYDFNLEDSTKKLTFICERFIEWLEEHRDVITDRKIFGVL